MTFFVDLFKGWRKYDRIENEGLFFPAPVSQSLLESTRDAEAEGDNMTGNG